MARLKSVCASELRERHIPPPSCPGRSAKRVFALDDPGIHLEKSSETMDCRVKPGNDEKPSSLRNAGTHTPCRRSSSKSACGLFFVSIETLGVMGPCVRRDDAGI